jgi:hypothetical protein
VFFIGLLGVVGVTTAILLDVAGDDRQAQACLAFMFLCSAMICFLAVFTALSVAFQAWLEKAMSRAKEARESECRPDQSSESSS